MCVRLRIQIIEEFSNSSVTIDIAFEPSDYSIKNLNISNKIGILKLEIPPNSRPTFLDDVTGSSRINSSNQISFKLLNPQESTEPYGGVYYNVGYEPSINHIEDTITDIVLAQCVSPPSGVINAEFAAGRKFINIHPVTQNEPHKKAATNLCGFEDLVKRGDLTPFCLNGSKLYTICTISEGQ
jgi:hypothetical protein